MLLSDLQDKDFPEGEHIVIEERNGLVEALHRTHVAVVDRKGRLRYSSGDPHHFTFTRSCIKPIQALPVLYLGAAENYKFNEEEIAMCSASHSGEEVHINIIKKMMEKISIDTSSLKCGGHPPFHKGTAKHLQGKFNKLHDNCSGKHTGAIATCKQMGWDINSYTNLDHPLTKEIVNLISSLTGMKEEDVFLGVDGCDIPNFGLPINKMAQLFAILADPDESKLHSSLKKMGDAFINNPQLIAGTDRFDTIMMTDHKNKLISKAGAVGLQTMAANINGEWLGISVKIEDGSYPACEVLSFHILKELGLFNEEGAGMRYHPGIIKTRSDQPVGSIRSFGRLIVNKRKMDRNAE